MAEVHVKGLADLQKFLNTLPVKLEKNIMRGALRAGMNVVKDAAKANVPVQSGVLRDGLKVTTRSRRGLISASVKAKGKHAFVAHMLEFTGAVPHEIVAKFAGSLFLGGLFREVVQHPGFQKKPFMRPALDAQAKNAIAATAQYIKKRLTKEGLNMAHVNVEGDE